MTNYFLFAGEISGDLHGSRLMCSLRSGNSSSNFCGVGGPEMRRQGLESFISMEQFQVMGFSDVLKSLPHLIRLFYQVRNIILKRNPECVILIDYPGFNLRLAKGLRKHGFKGKIVQYICPSVWAHSKNRIQTLNAHFDLLLTIYPFEAAYFSHTTLKVSYVGHPISETIGSYNYQEDWMDPSGLKEIQNLIALFPGSRPGEIQRHAPQQLKVAAELKNKYPQLRFAISCSQEGLKDLILQLIKESPLKLNEDVMIIPPQYRYELMKNCHSALAKSGTVTLELAYHETPTIVHYEVTRLNYFIAKYILGLSLSHYCIVNILGKKTIFPELIGHGLSVQNLTHELGKVHFDAVKRKHIQKACANIKHQLGNQHSHECAARAIQELKL